VYKPKKQNNYKGVIIMAKKFLGQEVKENKPGEFSITKTQHNAVLDELGVTKEVRDVIAEANEKIASEGIDFLGKEVLDTKKNAKIVLGTGGGKTTISLKAQSQAINPQTKEKIDLYGVASISVKHVVPKAIKDGQLADLQSEIAKAFA
jgi:hypothetical protein